MNSNKKRAFIVPTMDLAVIDGAVQAVLVKQGKIQTILGDPTTLVKKLRTPHFQLANLAAVLATSDEQRLREGKQVADVIRKICIARPCYVAGGIRTLEQAKEALSWSAKRITVSTNAREIIGAIPRNRIIVAFDVNQDFRLLVKGRQELLEETMFERLDQVSEHVDRICVTFHHTEGMGEGLPWDQLNDLEEYLQEKHPHIRLTVAGGIHDTCEIGILLAKGICPQFGYGIWQGQFTLGEAAGEQLNKLKQRLSGAYKDSEKVLYPTIVQHTSGKILGLVYSSKKSLKISIDTGKATFYSRDRNKLWEKGEISGNMFELLEADVCCDGTSMVFLVEPSFPGAAFCHTGSLSCYGGYHDPNRASFKDLYELLLSRTSIQGDEHSSTLTESYSQKLLSSPELLISKIQEEVSELVSAVGPENIRAEAADVIYFLTMFLLHHRVDISSVLDEVNRRQHIVEKPRFVTLERPQDFTIGVCFLKGDRHNTEILELLSDFGLSPTSVPGKSLLLDSGRDGVKIKRINPKDVSTQIHNDLCDAIVCYHDVIENYPVKTVNVAQKDYHQTKIAILAPEGFSFDNYPPGYKFKVAAEYKTLAEKWFQEHDICAKVIHMHGGAEVEVLEGFADLAVVVYDTGKTARENGLEVVEFIGENPLGFYVPDDKIARFQEIFGSG